MIMNAGGGSASEIMATIGLKWLGGGSPSDGPGAGPNGGDGDGGDADERKVKRDTSNNQRQQTGALQDINKKTSGYIRNTLGINIGIASILKQSQIFTGTLGTIFQILGALVDVILAPFLPIIVPAIKAMAENIPEIREKAQQIIGKAVEIVQKIAAVVRAIIGFLPGSFKGVLKDIIQYWILGLFLAKLFGMHKIYLAATKALGILLQWGFMKLFYAITGRQAMGGGAGAGAGGGGGVYPGPRSTYGGGAATRAGTAVRAGGRGLGMMRGLGAVGGAGMVYGGTQVGGGGGMLMGALGGAMLGGTIGSVVPVIGTAMGAAIGAVAGGALALIMGNKNDEAEQNSRNADLFNANYKSVAYRGGQSGTGMVQWG